MASDIEACPQQTLGAGMANSCGAENYRQYLIPVTWHPDRWRFPVHLVLLIENRR